MKNFCPIASYKICIYILRFMIYLCPLFIPMSFNTALVQLFTNLPMS